MDTETKIKVKKIVGTAVNITKRTLLVGTSSAGEISLMMKEVKKEAGHFKRVLYL